MNIFISGTQCPTTPAPACVKVYGTSTHSLCAPANEIIFVPGGQPVGCPEGYQEVTGDPEFADLVATHADSRICHRQSVMGPPVLGQSGQVSTLNCLTARGKFLCPAPKLPNGTYSVLWDKTTPPKPDLDVKGSSGGTGVFMEEVGPGGMVNFRIKATDPNGLGGVELMEWLAYDPQNSAAGTPTFLRWHADPALFSGAAVKNYDSLSFQLPYLQTDPVKRHFFARVYDRAGNSSLDYNNLIVQSYISKITIDSFTVTPTSVPLPGGPVTISWSVSGASAASIDMGVGTIPVTEATAVPSTGSRVVNVSAGTSFTLTATHPTRNTKTATAGVALGADTTAPAVSLSANPATVVAPGSTLLTATASDSVGVTKVEFYRGATLLGTDTTAPYEQSVAFTPADIGSVAFTAKAYDAANNSATSAVLDVSVGADVTAPSVSLAASPGTVLVPGSTTLLATATHANGVTKDELYRNGTLIATDTTAPFQHTVAFTAADVGSVSFTAKAFDAQGNNATSVAAIVTVSTPSSGDTYAGPNGVDAGNTTCAQATPCLSIAKAASLSQAGKTVWLQDGTYTQATQPALIDIPAGLTVRALTPSMAVLQQSLVLQGSATVVGVTLDRGPANNYGTSIRASSGSVTLEAIRFTGLVSTNSPPIAASGSAVVTLSPGVVADYTDMLTGAAGSANVFAMLTGSAQLTINGGSFGGNGLGGGSGFGFAAGAAAFQLQGNSRLAINNATVSNNTNGIYLNGAATQLNISNSTLTSIAMQGIGRGINVASGTPVVTLVGSTVSGFVYGGASAALGIGLFSQDGPNATVSLTDVVLSGSSIGLIVENGATATSATITGSNLAVKNNYFGGLSCFHGMRHRPERRRDQRQRDDDPRPGRRLRVLWRRLARRQRQGLQREAAQRLGDQQRQPVHRQHQHRRQLRHHPGRHGSFELRPGHGREPGRQHLHGQHDRQPDERDQREGRARDRRRRRGQYLHRQHPGRQRGRQLRARYRAVRRLDVQPDERGGRELPGDERRSGACAVATHGPSTGAAKPSNEMHSSRKQVGFLRGSLGSSLLAALLPLGGCGGGDSAAPPAASNTLPSAAFTAAGSVAVGVSLPLDASAASDADGDALTYSWELGNGQHGGGRQIAALFAEPGTFVVRLTVADGRGRHRQITPSRLLYYGYTIVTPGKHLVCLSYVSAISGGGFSMISGAVWGPSALFDNYAGDVGVSGPGNSFESIGDLRAETNTLALLSGLSAPAPLTARLVLLPPAEDLSVGAAGANASIEACQRRYYRFAGTAGQGYTVRVTAAFPGSVRVYKISTLGDVERTSAPSSAHEGRLTAGSPNIYREVTDSR